VVFSAHAIPGNEEMVFRIVNRLFQRGADVLYERIANVHVSGHASQEEMKLLINLVRPKFLIPIHGELRHLKQHGILARKLGIPEENIAVVENGTPLALDENSLTVGTRMPGGYIFVDGAGVGEVGWSVVRDRDKLAQNGFLVAMINAHNGRVIGKPDIISKGIIDMNEAEELFQGAEETIARVVKSYTDSKKPLDQPIEQALDRYLYAETGKRPFVRVIVK
jgi:ribonuclease J